VTRTRAVVIGVGMIGRLHAQIYREHPQVELVAVVDVDEERVRQVADQLGVRPYTDVQAVLAGEDFEVASVATPEHVRFEPAVALAEAGKHLLLEKPLAPTLEEADRLVERCQATSVMIMVNFLLRFDPRYRRARELALNGTLGEICTMFARRRGTVLGAEVYAPWTDLLISTGIHDLDAMTWIADAPPVRVYAEGLATASQQWGHDDAVMLLVRFSNGAIGALETSWVLPATAPALLDASLHVVGTRGGVFIEGSNHGLSVVDSERFSLPDLTHWPTGSGGVEGTLRASLDHFIQMVRSDTDPTVGLKEARAAQELVAAAKASIRSHQPVMLPLQSGRGA
jgi:predicted dehydrogenase